MQLLSPEPRYDAERIESNEEKKSLFNPEVEAVLRTYNKTNSEIKVEARKLKVYYAL